MNKFLILTLSLILALSLLSGCSTKSKSTIVYKNGTYEVAFDKANKNGWLGQVKIKMENDKITNIDFNYKNSITGELITDDEVHAKLMYEATKITPATASIRLTDNLLKTQDVNNVDNVTGATTTTLDFKILSAAALENAKKGTPTIDIIPYYK